MKKTFLILAAFIMLSQMTAAAQEIAVSSVFSINSYDKFNYTIGYEIGYNQYFKPYSRLGIAFSQSFKNASYNYTFFSGSDGQDYYREVDANNQWLAISVNYCFDVLKKQKSKLFIGPELGLNYFRIKENGTELQLNTSEKQNYSRDYWDTNKIGLGLLLEYRQEIVSDKISLLFSTVPEVIFYSRNGLKGSSNPVVVGAINFNLGLSFNLGRKTD